MDGGSLGGTRTIALASEHARLTKRRQRALNQLSLSDRRRAFDVDRALGELWTADRYLNGATEVLSRLLPHAPPTFLYTRTVEGKVDEVAHTIWGGLSDNWDGISNYKHLRQFLRYDVHTLDRFANRPVNTRTLYRGDLDALDTFRQTLLISNSVWYQLRTTIYDDEGRFVVYCGLFRERRGGEFGASERRLFETVVPALRDGLIAARAVDSTPTDLGTLGQVLDAFNESAFLATDRGKTVFANRTARRTYPGSLPPWLSTAARSEKDDDDDICAIARVIRIDVEGRSLKLIVPRGSPSCAPLSDNSPPLLGSLPPSLARIAELLAAGLTDRDIADRLQMPFSTVRTYIARLYQRLDVHSRAELQALVNRPAR